MTKLKNIFNIAAVLILFSFICFPLFAEEPKYRGVMISPGNFQEKDLKVLQDWNANLIRWQLNCGFPHGWGDTATLEEYFKWLDRCCDHLDAMIPLLRESGIKVCLDLHTAPGGFTDATVVRAFREEQFADAFVETWKRLAARYKDEPVIWAYDLMNEPVETPPEEGGDPIRWRDLATRAGQKIREIDPDTPLIFEPAGWAHARTFTDLEPLDLPNVIYSFHQYVPLRFTHQGVWNDPVDQVYPGVIEGEMWDKEALRRTMKPVRDFQEKYHVPIFVGEFSAIRWAPDNSAYRYLNDVIELFEEYGWDWTYHAFREWSGWSVEYTSDRSDDSPAKEPTDRETLLRKYFAKNTRE